VRVSPRRGWYANLLLSKDRGEIENTQVPDAVHQVRRSGERHLQGAPPRRRTRAWVGIEIPTQARSLLLHSSDLDQGRASQPARGCPLRDMAERGRGDVLREWSGGLASSSTRNISRGPHIPHERPWPPEPPSRRPRTSSSTVDPPGLMRRPGPLRVGGTRWTVDLRTRSCVSAPEHLDRQGQKGRFRWLLVEPPEPETAHAPAREPSWLDSYPAEW
jgi:hypothetical protein